MAQRILDKLLEITHAQWILCCITKHHHIKGTIVLKAQEDLLKEIKQMLDMGVDSVADDDK